VNQGDPTSLVEDLKKYAERVTGWRRPSKLERTELAELRKSTTLRFKSDGTIPNNPYWPLLIYRVALELPKHLDPAAVFEDGR
jgi:hypothetical protein